LKKDCDEAKKRLESRAVVEQAKGIIMKQNGISEQEAYDYIRNVSREKNISMKKVAEIILMRRGK
ncbi:protein containing ANTAR domain protein, partial [gut metagenome]